jgi:hypothetical protein
MDLYDSCIVTLNIAGTVISIPAARALCSAISIPQDIIDMKGGHLSRNVPKGSGNWGLEAV